MNFLRLSDNWRTVGDEEEKVIDFPRDELIFRERDYSRADGGANGFYRSECFTVEKKVEFPRAHKLYLSVEGALDTLDIFVGGECVASVTDPCKSYVDVTKYAGKSKEVRLSFTTPEFASSYRGLGLAGEIGLLAANDELFIESDGVYFTTNPDPTKCVDAYAEIVNDSDEKKYFTLIATVFNARGRRVGKRARKFRLPAHSAKVFTLPVKISRRYEWSLSDAYLYEAQISLVQGDGLIDTASVPLGIRTQSLQRGGFNLGGRSVRFKGAVLSHDNGAVGRCSFVRAEERKMKVLKESGFNAVRFIGVPTEAALDALDRAGLMCITDIFDVLSQPKEAGDRHIFFDRDFYAVIDSSVRTLRKHPCVVGYGICDCPPESYGRGEGAALGAEIAARIRELDPTRFIVASACELEPTADEMLALGVRSDRIRAAQSEEGGMLSLAREKNAFRDQTADWFKIGDIRGYSCLYQRYQSDARAYDAPIIGIASKAERSFDAAEEAERFGVLGEFLSPAIDSLGTKKAGDGFGGDRFDDRGDIDITLKRKCRSYYREILFGGGRISKIVVLDPEDEDNELAARESWNLPRYLGRPVTVKVYTGGDVVALYLDGRLVGRKLAGRINKQVATFVVNYYPGRLEAVSFRKGSEYCRCSLESVSSPKAVKLVCDNKNVSLSEGGIAFIDLVVTDKEGRAVSKAQRNVEVTVSGDGELYTLTNADKGLTSSGAVGSLPVYDSRALIVVKGVREGKMKVKVTGEGLLAGSMTVKVKP